MQHGANGVGLPPSDDGRLAADDFLRGVRSMDVVFSRGGLLARVNWSALDRVMQALDAGLSQEFVALLNEISGPLYGPGAQQHRAAYTSIEKASSIAMGAVLDDYFRLFSPKERHPDGLIDFCSGWVAGSFHSRLGETHAVKIGSMISPRERAYVLARYAPPLGSIRFLHRARPAVAHSAQAEGQNNG